MKKLIFLITVLMLGSSGSRADQMATHGMLLFGNQKTYASHLPMFHAPHDYQVILELSLEGVPHSTAVNQYNLAKADATQMFTLKPQPMDLTKVISGEQTSFIAYIYKGHFEQGGQNFGPAKVNVTKIIQANKLSESPSSDNYYLLFGVSGEYFGAHLISGKPDFDQIVSIERPYVLSYPQCRGRWCPEPFKIPVADQQLPLKVNAGFTEGKNPVVAKDFLGTLTGYSAEVQKVNYLEINELSE